MYFDLIGVMIKKKNTRSKENEKIKHTHELIVCSKINKMHFENSKSEFSFHANFNKIIINILWIHTLPSHGITI